MKLDDFIKKYGNVSVDEEELKDLLGIKDEKYFIPEEDEEYYLVDVRGRVDKRVNRDLQTGIKHFENNELFSTEEEAEEYAEKRRFLLQMKRDFLDNSDVIDWDDGRSKHFLRYDYQENKIELAYAWNIQNTNLYTTNEDWLREYMLEHEEEIKKYYFEIEED